MAERVEGDRERNGTRLCIHGWLGGQEPAEADAEHVDVVAVALGGDHELGAVRGEGDLPGGGGELRGRVRVQAERAVRAGDADQEAAEDPVALHRAAVQRVEDVHQVTVDGHADRERAARAQHLAEREPVTADGEDRNRVAARVHGVEQAVPRIVSQRPLGCGVVDHGPGQDAAAAAGGVVAGRGQGAVGRPVVGHDAVAGGVVGLHEHGVAGLAGAGRTRRAREGRGGHGRHRGRRHGRHRRDAYRYPHEDSSRLGFGVSPL